MHPDFPPRVYFNGFNDWSLNIMVLIWYHPPDYWNFQEWVQRTCLEITRQFSAEGIDFAFPHTLNAAPGQRRQTAAQGRTAQNQSGLSPLIQEALLEVGTRPRNAVSESGVLVIFRGVNCNPGADPEDMVAIRMFITDQRIITMRRNRVRAVQDVHETLADGSGPTTVGEFFVAVVDRITERIGDVVVDIEDRVAEVEDTIVSAETAELRPRLAELRRESISLRRYIAPQRDMLARLTHERIAWLTDSDKTLLRETAERTARYVEDIDAARERALISQEELNNRLAERMNRAMYTLSIVAAIFLPLGLLTGSAGDQRGRHPGD
jgi:zinc transporter